MTTTSQAAAPVNQIRNQTMKTKKHSPKGFRVIWRNGGERRFRWQQVSRGFATRADAHSAAGEIRRMGYHAEIRHAEDLAHGLPESWDSKTNASDYTLANGWMVPVKPQQQY